jgi:predicted metal-dependent hydrolase
MCSAGGLPIESVSNEQLASTKPPGEILLHPGQRAGLQKAYDTAQVEIARRQAIEAQQAAIAAERQAAAEGQRQQMAGLQQQQQAEVARQAELQAEQAQRLERDRAAQQLRIAGARTAGAAVTQSSQILGKQQTKQGPTASVGKRPGGQVAGRRTAASSLQIGPTRSAAPGAGANLSV